MYYKNDRIPRHISAMTPRAAVTGNTVTQIYFIFKQTTTIFVEAVIHFIFLLICFSSMHVANIDLGVLIQDRIWFIFY